MQNITSFSEEKSYFQCKFHYLKEQEAKKVENERKLMRIFLDFFNNNLPLSWMNQVCNLYQPNLNVHFPLTYCGKVE